MEVKYSPKTYRFARDVVGFAMKIVFRPNIEGIENIPQEGPFILAGNHKSLLDIPLVAMASKKDIRFIAKEELFHNKLAGNTLTKLGAIPIKRNQADFKAIRTSIDVLKKGNILGIFPEGTRQKGETLGQFKAGASVLALKGNCPIIPFGISGEYKIGKSITIRFGEAISINKEDVKANRADFKLQEQVKKLVYQK